MKLDLQNTKLLIVTNVLVVLVASVTGLVIKNETDDSKRLCDYTKIIRKWKKKNVKPNKNIYHD